MPGELARIDERTILAQYGPITLTIQAWDQSGPNLDLAARAGEYSFSLLPRLAGARELFRRGRGSLNRPLAEPVLENMCLAVEAVGQRDLGPMAAVAGAVADEVLGWLREAGAGRAIVENGGDLALRLLPGQRAVVGIKVNLNDLQPSFSLELSGDRAEFWGVATSSGLGGRGLSLGLADAAVCLKAGPRQGERPGVGAVADAAATAVANSCLVDSPAVKRKPAELLDLETDIPGLLVTTEIGPLREEETDAALDKAQRFAQSLVEAKVLTGALVFLRGRRRETSGLAEAIAPLVALEFSGYKPEGRLRPLAKATREVKV